MNFTEEDITLYMDQFNVSRERAVKEMAKMMVDYNVTQKSISEVLR